MVYIILLILVAPSLTYIIPRIFSIRKKKKITTAIKKSETASEVLSHFIVRESKIVLFIQCFLFFLILPGFIMELRENLNVFSLGFCSELTMLIGLLYCFYFSLVRKVKVINRTIYYKRITKRGNFTFDEISKVRFGFGDALIIYCGEERMFAVEPNCYGYYNLLTRLIFEGVEFEKALK